jgi:hypothetical protein
MRCRIEHRFVFVNQARPAFPGAAGFDNRIAQVEFVPAGRASFGIELIEQRRSMIYFPGWVVRMV